MKNKWKSRILVVALVGLMALVVCAGCSTDPPLRTGGAQPMDNKSKPTGKQEQGGKMQPQGADVSQ